MHPNYILYILSTVNIYLLHRNSAVYKYHSGSRENDEKLLKITTFLQRFCLAKEGSRVNVYELWSIINFLKKKPALTPNTNNSNIEWFNPLYNRNVKTNKEIRLIDKHSQRMIHIAQKYSLEIWIKQLKRIMILRHSSS